MEKIIYVKLKELRLLRGISIDSISSDLQISVDKYNAIEKGEIDLKFSKVLQIVEILQINLSDLFSYNYTYV